jgi:hypothetical protein
MIYDPEVVQDYPAKENFKTLKEVLESNPIFKGNFERLEFTVATAGTHSIKHALGAIPTDILETWKTGAITWNYSTFTKDAVYLTTTGAVTFRGFIGVYGGFYL